MKQFLINTGIVAGLALLATIGLITVTLVTIDKGDYYAIAPDTKYIVLGHSHPECAINESMINNLQSFARSGAPYFYTYFKAKKLIENNEQIESLFLSFTYTDVSRIMDKKTWGNESIETRLHRYSAFMDWDDYKVLTKNNWQGVLKSQSLALQSNLKFLLGNNPSYIDHVYWGGYLRMTDCKTDSLLVYMNDLPVKKKPAELSETSLAYLDKIIALCKAHNVELFLMRTPIHEKHYSYAYEDAVQELLRHEYSKLTFLDFSKFPLKNADYRDFGHLNYKGANKFSSFFNELLQEGFPDQPDVADYVKSRMQETEKAYASFVWDREDRRN